MKPKLQLFALALLMLPLIARAQETSRVIPFNTATTLQPGTIQDVTVQLWDVPSGGTNPLFFEAQPGLSVDDTGNIRFVFGSLTPGDPAGTPEGQPDHPKAPALATRT